MNLYKLISRFSAYALIAGCMLLSFSSCDEDEKDPQPVHETSTVTDIEGNIYKTVKIGDQWWMAEDLKTTRFRDGSDILHMQSPTSWNDSLPFFCIYDNIPQTPGLLYNWFVVSDQRQIAPEGWRVPTDEDFKILEKYLGMDAASVDLTSWRGSVEGNQLKIAGNQGWDTYGTMWPDNASGFSAIAGGARLWNGNWAVPGLLSTGFWWTATEHLGQEAWYRHLDYKRSDVFRYHGLKQHGFAIRCIKTN